MAVRKKARRRLARRKGGPLAVCSFPPSSRPVPKYASKAWTVANQRRCFALEMRMASLETVRRRKAAASPPIPLSESTPKGHRTTWVQHRPSPLNSTSWLFLQRPLVVGAVGARPHCTSIDGWVINNPRCHGTLCGFAHAYGPQLGTILHSRGSPTSR